MSNNNSNGNSESILTSGTGISTAIDLTSERETVEQVAEFVASAVAVEERRFATPSAAGYILRKGGSEDGLLRMSESTTTASSTSNHVSGSHLGGMLFFVCDRCFVLTK